MRTLVSLVSLVSLVACSSTSTQGQQSNASNASTIGDQCTIVAQAFCKRTVDECKFPVQGGYSSCVTDNGAKCCGTSCTAAKISTDAKIQACVDALATATCDGLAKPADGNPLPAECRNVVLLPKDGGT